MTALGACALFASTMAIAACNASIPVDDCATPGCATSGAGNPVQSLSAATSVSGYVVDIDKLTAYVRMNPDASAEQIIRTSSVPRTPVYAIFPGARTPAVLPDVSGHYAFEVPQGVRFHLVAATNAATNVIGTYDEEVHTATSSPLTGVAVSAFVGNAYCSVVGLAAALGVEVETVQATGACIVATFAPASSGASAWTPSISSTISVSGSDLQLWAITNPTTLPPTLAQQDSSSIGYYAINGTSGSTTRMVSISATAGTTTFPAATCELIPGLLTFASVSGL